jgi:hypothetical protein
MGDPLSRRITSDQDASDFFDRQAKAIFARALAEGQLTSDGQLTAEVEAPSTEAGAEKPSGEPSPPPGGSAEARREAGTPGSASVDARQEGLVRAEPPRWRRLVSKITHMAGAWRRQRGRRRSQYQRHLLGVAKRVLQRAARDVRRLISDLRHEGDQRDLASDWVDFRDALAELGDSRAWEIFLQAQGLEGSETAKTAVADLAAHVARVTKDQISQDSLQILLLSIDTLLAEIEAVDAHLVTRERAEFLKATAERISVQGRVGRPARSRVQRTRAFSGQPPSAPGVRLSPHRALQRLMPHARPDSRGSSHDTARRPRASCAASSP